MAKKTYAELQAEIERLQAEAESVRQEELDGVIARIREAIQFYGLTPRDLGFSARAVGAEAGTGGARRGGTRPGAASRASAKSARAPKFRDAQGNVWSGRGPRPKWLRDALAGGKQLDDFAVR